MFVDHINLRIIFITNARSPVCTRKFISLGAATVNGIARPPLDGVTVVDLSDRAFIGTASRVRHPGTVAFSNGATI
jgi:hypothetical protein